MKPNTKKIDYNNDGKLDWKPNNDGKLDWKPNNDGKLDYNNDGKIDWKDYIFHGLTIVVNIVFTVINVLK